jgi:hypothetical protein
MELQIRIKLMGWPGVATRRSEGNYSGRHTATRRMIPTWLAVYKSVSLNRANKRFLL